MFEDNKQHCQCLRGQEGLELNMVKVAEFIAQHRQGKISNATIIKMAAFKAELEKTAAGEKLVGAIRTAFRDQVPTIIAGSLGTAAGMSLGGLIFEGIRQLEKHWTAYKLDSIKAPRFEAMLDIHPELKENKETEERAALYFDSLWHFSPTMAQDPLAAGTYIKQALNMHHVSQGPLPEMVQRVTDIQKNIKQSLPEQEYATPLGAVFLPFKPQANKAYKQSDK